MQANHSTTEGRQDGIGIPSATRPFAVANKKQRNETNKTDTKMKTITETILYLQMSAMFLAATFASYGAASVTLPFHGTVQQVETQIVNFPFMSVEGSGTGNASLLGRFTETFEHEVNLLTTEGIGSATFTGANGDSISTEIAGSAGPDGTLWRVMEQHTVIGGTGRFEGATGSFTLVRFFDSISSVISSGWFEGTIVIQRGK